MNLQEFLQQFENSLSQGSVISLIVAFGAGVIACAICPCTLPVGLGIAGIVSSNTTTRVSNGIGIAVSFCAAIIFSLTILGAIAGHIGGLLTITFGKYWALAMAVISAVAAGVAFYGPYLKVSKLEALRRPGMGGSFIYGVIFTLGTSVAPLLLVLSIATSTGNVLFGSLIAFAFGVGRSLPFFIAGLFGGAITSLAKLSWLRKSIQLLSGLALLFVCGYYVRVFIILQ
jgi:cytochrome c-type biogenesis protein